MISGKNLQTAIKHKGLTVEDAATKMGLSRATLQNYFKHAELAPHIVLIVKDKLKIDLKDYEVESDDILKNKKLTDALDFYKENTQLVREGAAPYGKKVITNQEMVDMARKTEALAEVTLLAVAEVLALASKKPVSGVIEKLQGAVNKRLSDF